MIFFSKKYRLFDLFLSKKREKGIAQEQHKKREVYLSQLNLNLWTRQETN